MAYKANGAYLRTNYRITGRDLDVKAIGGGFMKGSARGGSALEQMYWGGFVANSVSDNQSAFSIQPLTGVIYSYWGGGYDSGYRIAPLGVMCNYLSVIATGFAPWISMTDSTDSIIHIGIGVGSISLTGSMSANFIFCGFICSAPNWG